MECTGILLGELHGAWRDHVFPILLVGEKDDAWERIGLLPLEPQAPDKFDRPSLEEFKEWISDWIPLERKVLRLG